MAATVQQIEPVVALPFAVKPAAQVRSILLLNSVRTLREAGLFDNYCQCLSAVSRTALSELVPGQWAGIELAAEHYEALDALGLLPSTARELAETAADWLHRNYLAPLWRSARADTVTPWSAIALCDRIWSRLFTGGAAASWQVGPREALLEIHGIPLAHSANFRALFVAIHRLSLLMFARVVVVRELPAPTPQTLAFRATWA
jgi:hypothetical protein